MNSGRIHEVDSIPTLQQGQYLRFSRNVRWLGTMLLLALMSQNSMIFTGAVAADEPPKAETPAERDARMQWWREARFGMFIHWGVYSVPAGTYQGKQIAGIGEWIMNRGKIPVNEYKAYAKEFNPVKFDAEAWVKLAKEAGMKYLVITSKHHDGFAMFKSKVSDWNIADATPFGRDPLKELASACQKYGLKLGFYYSQAQDWTHPGGAASGGHWDPAAQDGNMDEYIRTVAVPQVREILSNYGRLAVLWWDTPVGMTKERADQFLPLLQLQPGIITNNRLGGGYRGDTDTPEQFIPATGIVGRDWETCMTMNNTWGYKSYDNNWKTPAVLVRNLIDIASKGGNYLLNVGPTSEGLIPQPSIERLGAIGKWMKVNSEAIYATSASPFKRLPWGRCTKKPNADETTLYFHVFNWPSKGTLLVPGLHNQPQAAFLLSDALKIALPATVTPEGVSIAVPGKAPDEIASVVVLTIKGQLDIEQILPSPEADGSLTLLAVEAVLHGNQIQYESGSRRNNIGRWLNPQDWVEWPFEIKQSGQYNISAEVAAKGSGAFQIIVGDQKLQNMAANTGDYARFTTMFVGTLEIKAGKTTLAVKPVMDNWKPFNLRSIKLKLMQ